MESNYQVVIKGVALGYDFEGTANKLAKLAKLPFDEAKQILLQKEAVVKENIDFQLAVKYVDKLEECGCVCIVRPTITEGSSHTITQSAAPTKTAINDVEDTTTPVISLGITKQEIDIAPVNGLYPESNTESEQPQKSQFEQAKLLQPEVPKKQLNKRRLLVGAAVVAFSAVVLIAYTAWETKLSERPLTSTETTPETIPSRATEGYEIRKIDDDSSISTAAGELATKYSEEIRLWGNTTFMLGDKKIAEQAGGFVEYLFSSVEESVLLISDAGAHGTSCPGGSQVFLTITRDGKVSSTEEFGNCSDLYEVKTVGQKITVEYPIADQNMSGTETWTYEKGSLTKKVNAESTYKVNTKNLKHVKADGETEIELAGEVIEETIEEGTSIFKNSYLKLDQAVVIDNKWEHNGVLKPDMHDGEIIDELKIYLGDPNRFPPPQKGLKGKFIVTISCISPYCSIDSIRQNN